MSAPSTLPVPDFILKLHQMIQNYPQIISFSSNGQEVLIHSYEKFVSYLLPRYFRHKNWRSFVRQMNMYNFRKLNRGLEIYMFVNEIFREGNEQNYQNIKRKQVSRNEIDHTAASSGKPLLVAIREEYGVCSISDFVFMVHEFQQKTEKSCKQLKKSLEMISNLKRTLMTRSCASRVKDSSQTISEAAKKMKESVRTQYQYYAQFGPESKQMFLKTERPLESEMSLYREIIKSSLVKPKPISSGLNLPKFPSEVSQKRLNSSQNINIPVKIEENERENTFVISNLCSFNSYDRCVSL